MTCVYPSVIPRILQMSREHFVYAPSQWEMVLQCNVASHWGSEPKGHYLVNWHFHMHFDINSLAPGKFEWHFRYLISQIISVIDGWGISFELALRWMSLDLTDNKSTLVQVMDWCRQATSHYLSQCWLRSLSLYGVSRLQCIKVFLYFDSNWCLFPWVQLTISQHWFREWFVTIKAKVIAWRNHDQPYDAIC